METKGKAPKEKRQSKRQQQKGTGKAGISPDRQEDREGLPYLVIQVVISDGLNIHLIHMAQHIQSITLSHITQNPHRQARPCHQTAIALTTVPAAVTNNPLLFDVTHKRPVQADHAAR